MYTFVAEFKTAKKMKKMILTICTVVAVFNGVHAQSFYGSYGAKTRHASHPRDVQVQDFYGSYETASNSRTYNNSSYGITNSSVRYQQGYTRNDGTYVNGHYKTNSNGTNHDNFSTQGNYNPYTGNNGTRARDYSSDVYNYGAGQTIQTGSRGGQYYVNSRGNKVYVPKR